MEDLIDKQLILEGQNILLDRIPHHALINNWFSYKDVLSILIYIISLFLIYKNKRIFIPLIVLGFLSIFFTLIQFFTENNSLALTFPWRASVFLILIVLPHNAINRIIATHTTFSALWLSR